MKLYRYILSGLALIVGSGFTSAQKHSKDTTMTRTVVVEQEYNPEILDANKVNVLPKVEELKASKKDVEYATRLSPASSIPQSLMKPYTGLEIQPSGKPGYVRVGYGNYGNLDLFANYLFDISKTDRLNVNLKMDGMDGTLDMPTQDARWESFYYRTRANMDYTHQFNKLDLNVSGTFGLSNFNYFPYNTPKQKFTSGDIHVGVKSTDENLPAQFYAETNLMMYGRQNNGIFLSKANETQIRTLGGIKGVMNDEQSITIAFDMRNIFYNKDFKYNDQLIYENRTALALTPFYEFNNDSWRLHLGAHVDFSFGGGKTLRMSPDIQAQYLFSESYVIYAKATGGKQVNDFRRLEMFSPYSLPNMPIDDSYEQCNLAAGFKASPATGLWFNVFAGYQNFKDDLYEIYQTMGTNSSDGTPNKFLSLKNTNTHNLYTGLKVNYEYKDIVNLSASATYRKWGAKEDYALLLKPAGEFSLDASVQAIPSLYIQGGYDWIGRTKVANYNRINSVSNLYLGASYTVFKGISVYARINNLLNKKYQYYLNYPTEGMNFLGGMSFQF